MITGNGVTSWFTNESIAGSVAPAASLSAAPINLPHFGWVTLRAFDALTHRPVPYFSATASIYDPANSSTRQGYGSSRG
ncbi:MAG: hypothetical protein L3J96_06540, partial [Thermoplasmata archaeon]|nr:hypothetical protein [Thermoplasmata archaeon]